MPTRATKNRLPFLGFFGINAIDASFNVDNNVLVNAFVVVATTAAAAPVII